MSISLTNEEQELFDLVCSERLDSANRERLETLLSESPESRRRYLAYCAMHSDLHGVIRLRKIRDRLITAISDDEALAVERARLAPRSTVALGAALAIAATLLIAFTYNSSPPTDQRASRGVSSWDIQRWPNAVATVNRVENVVWNNEDYNYRPKDHLSRGDALRFESGLVEIEFRQGAVVVLEGPAHFVPLDPNGATLLAGKLAAIAPPWATGFRIDTPGIDVVDHGTEFAVSVTSSGGEPHVNVSVTEGEVEVLSTEKTDNGRRLLAGQGVRSVGQRLQNGDDAKTRQLTEHLPDRPSLKQGVLVADRWADWLVGLKDQPRSEGNWRYLANLDHPFGDPAGYVELTWDTRTESYRPPAAIRGKKKYGFVRAHRAGGHPGRGALQVKDGIDRYSITGFIVPEDGTYRIESGWLERYETKRWDLDEVLDIRFHVNSGPVTVEAVCNREGFVTFAGSLGWLQQGDVIYGGVGPRGVDHGDRFRWGFYIVRDTEETLPITTIGQIQ